MSPFQYHTDQYSNSNSIVTAPSSRQSSTLLPSVTLPERRRRLWRCKHFFAFICVQFPAN